MTSARRPHVVDLVDPCGLGALVAQWWHLACRLDDSSYFQTPAWVLAWWETVAYRPRTRFACWHAGDGELRALIALSHDRERLHGRLPFAVPVEVNAGSGAGAGDHCGFLVAPEVRADVAAWLCERRGSRPLLVRSARDGASLPAAARAVASTPCPRLDLVAPDDIGRSPNFRRQLARFSRRLERSDVRFAWVPSGHVDASIVATLFELHGRRRAAGEHPTSLTEQHRRLLLRLGETARPGCGPAAVVARHGGDTIGVLYGFEWNGCFSAYQSGWDPSYSAESLGSVLVCEAIRRAAAAGAHTFDFLRGSEPYKYRFGAHDDVDVTSLVARGITGRLLDLRYRLSGRASDGERRASSTRS